MRLSARRPTLCRIDLDALAANFHSAQSFIGSENAIMAVVKADAYGHGAVECSRRLEAEGVKWFAVATCEEALELRDAGIQGEILVLGGLESGQCDAFINERLTPVIFSVEAAEALEAAAASSGVIVGIHVEIDTGMGRVGVRFDEAATFARKIASLTHLRVDGMMTHFAAADDLTANEFTDMQCAKFRETVDVFADLGIRPKVVDLANSPGAIAHPASRCGLVRLGGVLYGLGGDVLPKGIDTPELKPVMSVVSQISLIKTVPAGESIGYARTFVTAEPRRIATVAIGYADGYPRALSNLGQMIVRGKPAPVVGRVSMDWTTIDVTDIPNASIGDVVTVIGHDGDAEIRAESLAADIGTISYEITCAMSRRVPRVPS